MQMIKFSMQWWAGVEGGRQGGAAHISGVACTGGVYADSWWDSSSCSTAMHVPCTVTCHPAAASILEPQTKGSPTCQRHHALHIHLHAIHAAACTAQKHMA